MKKFIHTIKTKWIKDTTLTIALVAILIAVFIFVNLLFIKLDLAPLDFTAEKIYSLSDESKEQIKNVGQNVTLFFFGYDEDSSVVTLAKRYTDVNDKIKIQVINTSERPDLAATYGVSTSSKLVAIQASERYKIIDSSEMYTYDTTTYETIDITEQKLTNGILDVTVLKKPQIYFLAGHGEYGINSSAPMATLGTYIVNDINDVKTLDLLTSDMPEICDALVIANPTSDFTDLETEKITNYINNGGDILWMQDTYAFNQENKEIGQFPNVNKVLSLYGIKFSKGVVCEEETSHMVANSPDLIIPNMTYNSIVKDIYTDGSIILMDSGKIETVSDEELEKLGVTASAFLKSSDKSFYREDINSDITKRLDTDENGPFVLGEILTKKISEEKSSTLVAYSNGLFATNYQVNFSGTVTIPLALRNNKDIVLNTIAYLSNREDTIRIRKNTGQVAYTATESQNRIVLWTIFTIPVIIIITGVIVAIVRKRRK